MKRKNGEYGPSNSKKFAPTSHSFGQMNAASGMAYNSMVQPPYNMSGELTANHSIHQTYYTNYTNLQYIVDPNQYAAYYQAVPPHIASGMYHQPPPPPLPPDDSSSVKPPLPPGMPPSGMSPSGMSPPQNSWNRKQHQRTPNANNKFHQRFNKNHPPPPLPLVLSTIKSKSITSVTCNADNPNDEITVSKKAKRKPMSTRYTRKKEWDRDDAVKALALENEYNRLQKLPMLILKFPDPELNKDIVKSFSQQIDNVHFQQPSTARYCYVTLRPDANLKEVEHEIANISFGTGKVMVKKHSHDERTEVTPEEIDPYTLYIGNLPTNVTVAAVKDKFPTAQRIDIGFAQKMKYTRYAFIRYQTIDDSIDAFRNTFNLEMESRSLIVRFRRQKGNVGLPGETRLPKVKTLPSTPELPVTSLDFYGSPIDTPILGSPEACVEMEKPTGDLKLKSFTENKTIIKITDSSKIIPPIIEIETTVKMPQKYQTPSTLLPVVSQHSLGPQRPLADKSILAPQLPLGSVDSKENVIAEALELLRDQNQENVNKSTEEMPVTLPESVATSTESTLILSSTVKIKEEAMVNNEVLDDFIIGTRVKEEPEEYEDDNEFDEDESDDEMLDDDDDDEDTIEDKEEDDDDAALYDRFNHFHDMEFTDFDEKEEKPKIDELDILRGIGNAEDLNHSTSHNRSDYDDLFDNLNPNDNLEL